MRIVASLIALAIATPASAEMLVIIHADTWTMEGVEPVKDATIVIDDGRIVSVAPTGAVPSGAKVIDARGKPVTPGLVNAATQIGLVEVAGSAETRDDASTDERTPGYDSSRALNGNSTLVSLARADGVTRALIYPSPSRNAPMSGEPVFARLRDGVDILDRGGVVAVYAVIGGGAWDRLGARAQQWTALRKLLGDTKRGMAAPPEAAVRRTDKRGGSREGRPKGDGGHNGGPDGALRDVLSGKLSLAIETHRESDIRQAAALVSDFGIKVIVVGGSEAWRAADVLAAAKVAVVLDPQINLPFNFDQLGARQDNAAILAKAGVPIAIGQAGGAIHTTYNAGMGLREGAGIAVSNGLPYIDALRAITVNPLAIWGRAGGELTPGADADLVIWDGDPLEPSTNAVSVIIEGRLTTNRSRQDMLGERYRDAR